jgi:hypothetical protein
MASAYALPCRYGVDYCGVSVHVDLGAIKDHQAWHGCEPGTKAFVCVALPFSGTDDLVPACSGLDGMLLCHGGVIMDGPFKLKRLCWR